MTWSSKPRCLLLIYFLLSDMFAQASPPHRTLTINQETIQREKGTTTNKQMEPSVDSVDHLISALATSLRGHVHLHGNLSCVQLAAGPWKGSGFSEELLGLVMVPVLIIAQCIPEAQGLVLNLYELLGQDDTQEFLEDIVAMIIRESKTSVHTYHSSSAPPKWNKLQAIMFNIQKLAEASQNVSGLLIKDGPGLATMCQDWLKVKGTHLLGEMADNGGQMYLSQAKQFCQNLGLECAGVTQESDSRPGLYRVILRSGSRVVPSTSSGQSESWIHNCGVGLLRLPRQVVSQSSCKNEQEEQVYKVVEWIPAVSTLYNLGTAVYYASMKCSNTAKQRAMVGAVDVGTDVLMAVTGGTAGVVGYVLGAGLKTSVKAGVKYLINGMNQEEGDLLMNQKSWEEGTFTIQ